MNTIFTVDDFAIAALINQRNQQTECIEAIMVQAHAHIQLGTIPQNAFTLGKSVDGFVCERIALIDSTSWSKLFDLLGVFDIFPQDSFAGMGFIDNGAIACFKAESPIRPIKTFTQDNINAFIADFGTCSDAFLERAQVEIKPFIDDHINKIIDVEDNLSCLCLKGEWIDRIRNDDGSFKVFLNKKVQKTLFKIGFIACSVMGESFDADQLKTELSRTDMGTELTCTLGCPKNRVSLSDNILKVILHNDVVDKISEIRRWKGLINNAEATAAKG